MTPQSPTLLHIRYYDQHLHPDSFEELGWRGRWVRVLNWVRFWLETYIQYRVLLLGVEKAKATPSERSEIVSQFMRDVRAEKASVLPSTQSSSSSPSSLPLPLRSSRYRVGRDHKEETEEGDVVKLSEGKPLGDLVFKHTRPPRQARYLKGPVVMEEQFEAVERPTTDRSF